MVESSYGICKRWRGITPITGLFVHSSEDVEGVEFVLSSSLVTF